ncbi:MAG TPA: cyclopropane-fatty-acyl-phospholipid synthase family protein [Steroidobacteraceae bacterium]
MNEPAPADALHASTRPADGALDRLVRGQLLSRLSGMQHGRVVLADPAGRVSLGNHAADASNLDVRVEVLDPGFYRRVALNGSVGAAEAYIDGLWRCENLVDLIRLLVRNRAHLDGLESGAARLGGWVLRAWHAFRRNTPAGASRNIAAHYDLGNDFFGLFLSSDLMYSAAIWDDEGDTLESASLRKLECICRKLDLRPGHCVCEIGSGWGGLAFHAAANYGCRVTAVTISRRQYEFVSRQIQERGLGERVQVLLKDYRELTGQYDKVVSIEMIEAVGAAYLETYFATLSRLLTPGGRALIQAITIEDHRYAQALASVDYIKRYIFPGSFIPSIQTILTAKMRACDLALVHLEDFGESYARTLREWRKRFLARLPEARALGFDERFVRMWEYYLAYCEGGFLERSIGVAHLVFDKPGVARGAWDTEPRRDVS